MKTIKAKYYLIPAIICLVVIGGLVYYYFLTDVAKEDKVLMMTILQTLFISNWSLLPPLTD